MKITLAADPGGGELKNAVKKHLIELGHEVRDLGGEKDAPVLYPVVGDSVAKEVQSGKANRGIVFCGTGMGIHIAASKCPHVHAAVCESVPAALRCVTANNCNVLAMGGFYVAPRTGMAMADAFLEHKLGDGYEDWEGFYEFHKLGYDELEHFDYEAYKANGFQLPNPGNAPLGPEPLGHAY